MNVFLQTLAEFGPILTGVGLLLTFWALKASHDWNRRKHAAELISEWNEKTAIHRKAIERIRPGLVDLDNKSREVVELSKTDALEIYLSKPTDNPSDSDLWELRFHLIELLNYFESIAVAYRNRVGDKRMLEESMRNPLVRWHEIFHNFIVVVKEQRGYEPWEPYIAVVDHWKERPFKIRRRPA